MAIREAIGRDVPVLIGLVKDLHVSAHMTVPIDDEVVRQTLHRLILSPQGLVLVAGERPGAFLAASIGFTTVSASPVAQEHGWYAAPEMKGVGLKLLIRYEQWAKEQGCQFIRMSTPPENKAAASILERRGFLMSEIAHVKAV